MRQGLQNQVYVSLLLCCCLIAQSCLTLCNPKDCSPPGPSVHGIFQARTLEWVAILFSRGSSQPRDQTWVSCIDRWATWEALYLGLSFNEAQLLSSEKSKENKKERSTELSALAHGDSTLPCPLGACRMSSKHWLLFSTVVTHFISLSFPISTLKGRSTCRGGGSGGSSRNPLLSDWKLFALFTTAPAERSKETSGE